MSFLKSLFGSVTKTTSSGGYNGGYSRPDISKLVTGSGSEPKTELGRAIKDIVETTEQTKQEMKDIVVDTARDIVGLGPSDKKIANDTKEEADEIIAKANAKLERQRVKVEKKHSEVKGLLNKLLDQKKSLLNTTVNDSQKLSTLFENTDWESKIAPTLNKFNTSIQLPSKNFTASFMGYSNTSVDLINLFLSNSTNKANLNAAKEYLEEAKTYSSEINYQVEKMGIAIANLEFTQLLINEESRILTFFEDKLKTLNVDLTKKLNKSKINQNELEEVKNVYKMVSLVADTLKDKMFHADSRISHSYIETVKQLDILMSSTISSSPKSPEFKEYVPLNIKIINY
ncbi:hypothetical protein L2D08_07590 [Domibacillus sp. PGB-M46]|uniref:hypothetical protein n=1 Tax=Domibacillus sp. PGB-M46 TaxID=2910255 RepID=UPI001F5A4F33|nr:hypothetical protein [Domibacillus sp. PGB-M46]MCI2254223.1 hypothetical protein [Domibacillus sp. PGB-M46]